MASAAQKNMQAAEELYTTLFKDCIYNVIHDTVLEVHRSEKLAHMQSAAIIAQQAKESAKETSSPGGETHEVQTDGAAITEDDRVLLRGNPFVTAPEILCPNCRLPRLYHPITGRNSKPPDGSKQYCQKQPYIQKDGCDIYGKSLALEKPSKKSKAQRAADAKTKNSPGGDGSGSDDETNAKDDKTKPAATAIPSGKCPNCPRYMAFTRIAQHMDRCLGLSGRASSKNAMTKMSGSQGTPNSGSRASTPKPSGTPNPPGSGSGTTNNKKRKLEKGSDDEDDPPPTGGDKKKKKLTLTNKKVSNPNLARVKSADKRPPNSGKRSQSPQTKIEDDSD